MKEKGKEGAEREEGQGLSRANLTGGKTTTSVFKIREPLSLFKTHWHPGKQKSIS